MEQYFEGQWILEKTEARLCPPSDAYPDAECALILTAEFLYVLEDNFNGTHTCLFKIPIEKIKAIKKYAAEKNDGTRDKEERAISRLAAEVIAALAGMSIYVPASQNRTANADYLQVEYRDAKDSYCALFFENCVDTKRFIRAFDRRWR